jgi:DNA-binding NarL/FixJ family response regulator
MVTFGAHSAGGSELVVMSVRIAVRDSLPVYQRGMIAILSAWGTDAETPDDLLAWVGRAPCGVVFLTLESAPDWELLAHLGQTDSKLVTIAMLTEGSMATYVRALSAGAVTAMPRDASPERVRRVFEAALDGESMLPTDVVRALTGSPYRIEAEDQIDLPDREISWLRELAAGTTVAQLAERSGYSERAMFRLLRQMYTHMKVKTRTEALLRARQQGWL